VDVNYRGVNYLFSKEILLKQNGIMFPDGILRDSPSIYGEGIINILLQLSEKALKVTKFEFQSIHYDRKE